MNTAASIETLKNGTFLACLIYYQRLYKIQTPPTWIFSMARTLDSRRE